MRIAYVATATVLLAWIIVAAAGVAWQRYGPPPPPEPAVEPDPFPCCDGQVCSAARGEIRWCRST